MSLERSSVVVFVRALTYATLFVAVVLVFLPARLLSTSGITTPPVIGVAQVAAVIVTAAGAALALWCVLTFALLGKGTPAPFDPPRFLVIRGPYKFVRNPMYIGGATALAGAALFYQSAALAVYTAVFLCITHTVVMWYEEPTLRGTFGADYDRYRSQVRRWWPRSKG